MTKKHIYYFPVAPATVVHTYDTHIVMFLINRENVINPFGAADDICHMACVDSEAPDQSAHPGSLY